MVTMREAMQNIAEAIQYKDNGPAMKVTEMPARIKAISPGPPIPSNYGLITYNGSTITVS